MIDGWSNQELKRFAKWQLQKDFDSLTDNQFIHKFKRFYKLEEFQERANKDNDR